MIALSPSLLLRMAKIATRVDDYATVLLLGNRTPWQVEIKDLVGIVFENGAVQPNSLAAITAVLAGVYPEDTVLGLGVIGTSDTSSATAVLPAAIASFAVEDPLILTYSLEHSDALPLYNVLTVGKDNELTPADTVVSCSQAERSALDDLFCQTHAESYQHDVGSLSKESADYFARQRLAIEAIVAQEFK